MICWLNYFFIYKWSSEMLPVFTSRHIVAFFFSYLCNLFLEDVVLSKRKLPLKFYNLSPPVLFRYNCHMVLYKFKIWRKITYIHCKMITTILLVIIHHLVLIQNKERNFFFPFVMWNFTTTFKHSIQQC